MDIRFDGKRALVTGAGKGIGRAVAKALLHGGAETYALTRTQADLDSLKQECPSIQTVCVDLADWDSTRKAVQDLGVIDLLVNNAGVFSAETFLDTEKDEIDRVLTVNVKAIFNVSQVVAKGMVERGSGGAIVNVSSQASARAWVDIGVYCVSKAAVDQLTRVMALELGPHQIRVNAVNPTLVLTDMGKKVLEDPEMKKGILGRMPLGRFVEEHEVVEPILYLLSDKSSMINGDTLRVEGGLSIS